MGRVLFMYVLVLVVWGALGGWSKNNENTHHILKKKNAPEGVAADEAGEGQVVVLRDHVLVLVRRLVPARPLPELPVCLWGCSWVVGGWIDRSDSVVVGPVDR